MFPRENSNKPKNKGISYVTVVGIVFIELLLSAAWLSFSVFYTELVELGIASTTQALWIPIIVISVRTICNPLSRKICEHFSDNDCDNYRFIIAISSLTAAVIIILGACSRLILIQALTYGIFCGLSSSLIFNQLKDATYEDFQSKPQLFEGLQQVAKALSLFFMPHIFSCLVSSYGVYEAEFLFAALLLHIIPLSMIVKRKQRCTEANLSRYRTVSTLPNEKTATLPTFSHTFNNFSIAEDDSSSSEEEELNIKDLEVPTNPVTAVNTIVPLYRKNFVGVDILPQIPEEDEIEEDNNEKVENVQIETMKDSITQYSRLSAKFEDLIINESNDYHSIERDFHNTVQKFVNTGSKRYNFKHFMKCGCSPYRKYLYKKRWNRIIDFFCEVLLKPLWKALRVFAFYPCLFTKVLMMLIPAIYVVFVPYIAVTIVEKYSSQTVTTESAILLSLIAFPWLCFLVFLPWLLNASKSKIKAIFCVGIVTLGISTFFVNLRLNYDIIAIASLLFGIAYGGMELSQEIVFKEVAGVQRWRNVRDPLDVIAGLLTIGLYGVISAFDVSIFKVLGGSTVVSMLLASVWLFIFFKDKIRFGMNVGL